jgi:hypothetical protein
MPQPILVVLAVLVLLLQSRAQALLAVVEAVAVVMLREVQAALEVVVKGAFRLVVVVLQTARQTRVAVVVVHTTELAAQVALALSSLKYLTTYPQHFLVALHRAYPHLSLGSTSTL